MIREPASLDDAPRASEPEDQAAATPEPMDREPASPGGATRSHANELDHGAAATPPPMNREPASLDGATRSHANELDRGAIATPAPIRRVPASLDDAVVRASASEADDAAGRPAALLRDWSDALAASLYDGGVRDVVVSPGSRSTPFVFGCARHGALRLHSVIDERAAAFFGLGIARVTGRPPVLLCTSGSAPAHYAPAVMEASESGLPLIVLSADRPRELAHAGAPQTSDQHRLYGAHARFFADLGEPDRDALPGMRRLVATAIAIATGADPGPVQLDARARKPLEPAASSGRRVPPGPVVVPASLAAPPADTLARIADALGAAERPALVAGPLALAAREWRDVVARLGAAGVTLIAECASQLRLGGPDVPRVEALERGLSAPTAPDVVLEIGATPTSAAYAAWLARGGPRRRFVLAGARPRDPSGAAEAIVLGDVGAALEGIAERLRGLDPAARRSTPDVERVAAEHEADPEARAVRDVARLLPAGALLAIGNSLPLRHADRVLRRDDGDLRVIAQRGVNGIDGWIAGAAGAAIADGGPMAVILGDVAAAHDASSLALARLVRTPLLIVVLDNGGGRIFEQLPVAHAASAAELSLFTTPPDVEFEALARAYGVRYARADARVGVRDAVVAALGRGGATLVHVACPRGGA